MSRWMDGEQMDGWMERWVDEWISRWMDEQTVD